MNYYQGTKEHPYHVSVGAVILNEENKVCCHYFGSADDRHKKYSKYNDFYILMRETMEMGETPVDTLHRGLREEFGITADIVTYIGSIKSEYEVGGAPIEKTTLYFLVRMKSIDITLRSGEDVEAESEMQWHNADFLIEKMKEQAVRLNNSTLDESDVLMRIGQFI